MITRGTSISGNLHVSEQVFHMNAGRYYTMWATPKWYVFHAHLIAEMPTMFIQQRWSRIYHHWWDDDSNKCFLIKKWIQKKEDDSFAKHVLHNSNMDCLMMNQQFSDALEKTPNRTNGMTLETWSVAENNPLKHLENLPMFWLKIWEIPGKWLVYT